MRTGGGKLGANNDIRNRFPSKLRRARHTLHAYHVAGVSDTTGLCAAGARYKHGRLTTSYAGVSGTGPAVPVVYCGSCPTVTGGGREPPGAGELTRLPALLPQPGRRMLEEAGLDVGRDVGGVGRTNSSRCAASPAPASCAVASCPTSSSRPSCATVSAFAARYSAICPSKYSRTCVRSCPPLATACILTAAVSASGPQSLCV